MLKSNTTNVHSSTLITARTTNLALVRGENRLAV